MVCLEIQRQRQRQGLFKIQITPDEKDHNLFQTRYDLTNEHSSAGDGNLRSSHHLDSDALVQTLWKQIINHN